MSVLRPSFSILIAVILVALIIATIPSMDRFAEILFKIGMREKGLEIVQKILDRNENNLIALKQLRDHHLHVGNVADALEVQKRLVKIKPKNEQYLLKLEELYDWNRMPYQKLLSHEKRLFLVSSEKREDFLNDLANGYRWLRKYKDANRVFQQLAQTKKLDYRENVMSYYLTTRQTDKFLGLFRYKEYLADGEKYYSILRQIEVLHADEPEYLDKIKKIYLDIKKTGELKNNGKE